MLDTLLFKFSFFFFNTQLFVNDVDDLKKKEYREQDINNLLGQLKEPEKLKYDNDALAAYLILRNEKMNVCTVFSLIPWKTN